MRKREITTTARRKAIDRIVSRILVFALCITLVPFTLATDANAFEEDTIVAKKDVGVNNGYTPTNLLNGKFEYHPELYPLTVQEAWDALGVANNTLLDITGATKTTLDAARAAKLANHSEFKKLENWKTTEPARQNNCNVISYFEWLTPSTGTASMNWIQNNFNVYTSDFVELNSKNMAIFYQDLPTNKNDIILWSLDHAARRTNPNEQEMEVEIGKAISGQSPTGENAKIQSPAIYTKAGVSGDTDHGFIAKTADLAALYLTKANADTQHWQTARGVYIVPEGQTTTRFAFKSITRSSMGNLLDNVVFETLLGNVKIFPNQENDPDNIKVTGYWALVDENEGASVEYEIYKVNENGDPIGSSVVNGDIDMSKLAQDPATPDWSALIPKDGLEPGDYIIKVNHSDYPEAKTSAPFTMNPDVIYDANGGGKTVDGETVTRVGDYDVELHAPYKVRGNDYTGFKKTGYTFKGWANDPNATTPNYLPGATIIAEENKTLYAVWEAKTYTVTYHNDVNEDYYHVDDFCAGTNFTQDGITEDYRTDESVTVKDLANALNETPETPMCYHDGAHPGIFLGWDTEPGSPTHHPVVVYTNPESFVMPPHDVDLYAVWEAPDHYTVLYHKNAPDAELAPGKTSPDTTQLKTESWTVAAGNVFARFKYQFIGWFSDIGGVASQLTSGDSYTYDLTPSEVKDTNGNINLYAKWEKLYQITYHDHYYVGDPGNYYEHDVEYVDTNYYKSGATPTVMSAADAKTNLPKADHILLGWTDSKEDAKTANLAIWNDPAKVNATDVRNLIKYSADIVDKQSWVVMPAGDLNLYAIWQPAYHLAYHANGGDAPKGIIPEVTGLVMGEEVTVHTNADTETHYYTRTGYTFAGWSLNPNGTGTVYKAGTGNSKVTVSGDTLSAYDSNHKHAIRHVDLYAKWEPVKYKVVYKDPLDASNPSVPVDGNEYPFNKPATIVSDPLSKDGYTFIGWTTDPDSAEDMRGQQIYYNGNLTPDTEHTVEVYAIWKPAHRVIYSDNCPADATHTGHVTDDTTYATGASAVVKDNGFVVPNYTFVGWNTKADGSGNAYQPGTSVVVPEGGIILHAQWKKSPIVTFDSQCDVIAPDAQQVDYNTPAKDPGAMYRPHYEFTGWYKDPACTIPFDFTQKITEDVTVYAGWNYVGGTTTKTDNTLTYESNGGTKYPTETYPNGTVVDLNKVPAKEGYIFTGWYSDAALTNKITDVTMNGSKTVYAGWKAATVPGMLNDYDHFAYVIGYPDGMVQPNGQITRAEIATIFFRLLKPEVRDGNLTTQNPFEDVKQGDWYNKPVSTMVKLGIVNGRTTTTFAPNAPITRAELATICARFDETVVDNGNLTFSDVANHWAYKEIGHAAALGWLMGYPDGTFLPDASITRAETMTLINRVLQRIPETESDLLPDMVKWPDNVSTQWYYLAVQEATNSHDFNHKGEIHETWTELTAVPDWTRYEN